MLPLLLILVATPPADIAPADSFRYRIVTKSTQEVDASAMGQPSQTVEVTTTALVTVSLTDSAGGQVAHITVDSAGIDAGEMAAMLDAELLKVPVGAFFHFFVKDGKVVGDRSPSVGSMPVANLMEPVGMLFSNPRPAAVIGELWSDTTKVDTTTAQGRSSVTTVSRWKFAGMEQDGRVLEAESAGTMDIDSPMGKMSGTVSGKQRLVARAKGPLVRLRSDTTNDMVMLLGTGQMNIKGKTTITVEPIP